MNQSYFVYPDRLREILSLLVYLLFIIGMFCVFFFFKPFFLITVFLIIFCIFMLMMMQVNVKKLLYNPVQYRFDEKGITDLTQPENPIFLAWDEIAKIEMVANNASLQIAILGMKTLKEKDAQTSLLKENLKRNGNMAFYHIIIDGFLYRKKVFKTIFANLKEMAETANPQILVQEYRDPLTKKQNKKILKP